MNSKLYLSLILALASVFSLTAQIVITDADLVGNTTYNWTNDNVYLLDGLVFLEEGGVLNIEAGTVIKGKSEGDVTTGDNTSALIISRGAQIFAEGSATAPIIFTASGDDVTDPGDFLAEDRGEWGGLIILGYATIARPGGEDNIEGINADETRARFGGGATPDDADNSGVLRYVSIRHGGAALAPGDEINGLTLGGVGAGTVIDYIEIFANLDDGIEWFGGTVNIKHAAVSFCGDDAFDYDFGYRGKGQFWFSLQSSEYSTGRAGEHDGANPDTQPPFSQPTIYNATYIGIGATVANPPGGDADDFTILMRDNAGGFYNNSIFTEFPGIGLAIEDRDGDDAFDRLAAGDIAFTDNTWFGFGLGNTAAALFKAVGTDEVVLPASSATVAATLAAANNGFANPAIASISREPNGLLDPRLNASSPVLGGYTPGADGFFQQVTYQGAFGNSDLWLRGWTALDNMGYLGDLVEPLSGFDCVTVTDTDLQGGQTYNWTANNCYILDGLVFLEAGGVLNIEPGTVIRGQATNDITTGDNTSALIIARGAQIFANGEADAPIVFTAVEDDLADPTDFTIADRGEWGGLIILGRATIARPGGEDNIEGINADEVRARFGGGASPDNADNSGRLKYVSIRHGGAALAPGDEINGLTLGGVGSGTEIDYIEIIANLDDGIEWFGGTVDVTHAAVSFCGDDAFDYDFGYRGRGQFWFSLQGPDEDTGRAGEHDGASPDTQPPFSQPTIFNATYVGLGANVTNLPGGDADDFAILMRDDAGGYYNNSIFTDFPGIAVAIEDRTGEDTFDRLQAGDLAFNNNFFFNFGAGTTPANLFVAVGTDEVVIPASSAVVAAAFIANNNVLTDPQLQQTDRAGGAAFDPRPVPGGMGAVGAPAPADAFFQTVPYFGAFAPGNGNNSPYWLAGWTAVDAYMQVGLFTGVNSQTANGFLLDAPVPNPANTLTVVTFELPVAAEISLVIVDVTGRPVMTLKQNERLSAGFQTTTVNTANLPNGMYLVVLQAANTQLLQKLIVNH
ncbi:MAG: T9SS C-terminal target domain-containing protein [Bacteroidetes bacterium]|nr:MAG: T9SS C-terminal target domain-containing protein [Bacteroidota bacterium]PTM14241.1 MAG: T9SS C-terminal target domain-containing protein [Bacteroidota bacterium]